MMRLVKESEPTTTGKFHQADVLNPKLLRLLVLEIKRSPRRLMMFLGCKEDPLREVHRIQRSCSHMANTLPLSYGRRGNVYKFSSIFHFIMH